MSNFKIPDIIYSYTRYDDRGYEHSDIVNAKCVSITITPNTVSVELEDSNGYFANSTVDGEGQTIEEAIRNAGKKLHKQQS